MRKLWLAAVVSGLVLAGGVQARAAEIGAVLAGTRDVFWQAMRRGIEQAATDLGVDVIVRAPVDDDETNVRSNTQLTMIDDMLAAGIKQLILAPMPVSGVKTPVTLPVPVVFVDRVSADYRSVSMIATDNRAAGAVAVRTLAGRLGKGAKVGVLRLGADVVSTTERERGFIEAARASGYDVVLDPYVGHGVREAQAAAAKAISAYPGHLDAVFAPNESVTLGALRALEDLPAARRPLLVGFDYRRDFDAALRQGTLYAVLVQDPYRMGYDAVRQCLALRSGQDPPRTVAVDVLVLTGADIDSPEIRKQLSQFKP